MITKYSKVDFKDIWRVQWLLQKLNLAENVSAGSLHMFANKYFPKRDEIIKIAFVGSNPGKASPDDSPFHNETKSYKFIEDRWLPHLPELRYVAYVNLVDHKTKDNKSLKISDIQNNLPNIKTKIKNLAGYKLVACGKTAAKGLTLAGVSFFEMPHPSGLCRFWNDKEAGDKIIKEMVEWLKT